MHAGFGLALLQTQDHLQALRQQCQTLFDPSLQGLSRYQLQGLAVLQALAQETDQRSDKQTRGPQLSGALALVLLSHVKEEAGRQGDGGHTGREVGEDEGESLNGQTNADCKRWGKESDVYEAGIIKKNQSYTMKIINPF